MLVLTVVSLAVLVLPVIYPDVPAGSRSAVSGLLLLVILLVSAWLSGGWINAAVIAVMAVAAVPVFAWARSRIKRDST